MAYERTVALRDVNLTVAPGERVALIGPSGAGKSTLLGLLLGFVTPTSGRVELGGVNLADVDLADWRRQVAWVPQRPHLFAGLDTRIGEGGVGLSSGQRQRVALARAFLRDAPVLLLDEPTARLDPASEAAVADATAALVAGRTTLLVAHRPALLALADRVVRVEDGRLTELRTADLPDPAEMVRALEVVQ